MQVPAYPLDLCAAHFEEFARLHCGASDHYFQTT